MTTLYRPVLIESAEQAEALPEETIAYLIHDDGFMDALALRLTRTDGDPRAWQMMNRFSLLPHDAMVGWTALVPIEAEEEWGLFQDDEGTMDLYADEAEAREWARIDGEGQAPSRRYTTPWKEA